jgi:hypothetical protein
MDSLAERNTAGSPHPNGGVVHRLARVFPPLSWLRYYESAWLAADAVAGVTLAAYAIPVYDWHRQGCRFGHGGI